MDTQYIQSGGKSVTHGWVEKTTSLGAVSHVVVQLFEHVIGIRFRGIIERHSHLRTLAFAHIPADCLLRQLSPSSQLDIDKRTLTVDSAITKTFFHYKQPAIQSRLLEAAKKLVQGRRKAARRSGISAAPTED